MRIHPKFLQCPKTFLLLAGFLAASAGTLGAQVYSIGDPTDEEQVYVELMNRARANPNAEALRLKNLTDANVLNAYSYFGVDLNLMVTQFASLSVTPPLSLNAKLTAAARGHSQDMLAHAYQGHTGSDSSTPGTRITAQGYTWTTCAENVGAYTFSPLYGHAGMEVDWGGTSATGGMQSPAGHRLDIHNASLHEVGVGVVNGTNASVSPAIGPQLVTQDFGTQSSTAYITGVAYYDFNANGFYDVGEGIGGVTVTVSGTTNYAVTSTSGGYSVPVPANGNYTVTFSAPNLSNAQFAASVTNGNNVKTDYKPAYTPATISVSGTATAGQAGTYNFNSVGAAIGYDWKCDTLVPFTAADGAESGAAYMTASVSAGYAVAEGDTVHSGAAAFHLAQVQPTDQSLTWNHTLRPAANSVLTFWSRLGYATSAQIGVVQVSTDGGAHWQDVWTQTGTNNSGQASFFQQNVSLASFAGKDIKIRFLYRFGAGTYYYQSSAGVGFYIDDISVSNAQELTATSISSAGNGTSFQFTPPNLGVYSLSVRAKLPGRTLAWGPTTNVTVSSGTPVPATSQIIWQNGATVVAWLMNGTAMNGSSTLSTSASGWQVKAFADLNGDGKPDIIWQSGGTVVVWYMNGTSISSTATLTTGAGGWQVVAVADLNGDSKPDIIWQNGNVVAVWYMNGTSIAGTAYITTNSGGWQIKAVADLNNDGKPDIIWQNGNTVAAWLMNGITVQSSVYLCTNSGGWQIKAVADLDGDGHPDLIWQGGGSVAAWLMNGVTAQSTITLTNGAGTWQVVGAK